MEDILTDWIDEYHDWPASVELVAQRERCTGRTVRKWAKANGIRTVGGGNQYLFYRQDILSFRLRDKPGRRWPDK